MTLTDINALGVVMAHGNGTRTRTLTKPFEDFDLFWHGLVVSALTVGRTIRCEREAA